MSPTDIRLLADASPYQRDMLRALADVVEAAQDEQPSPSEYQPFYSLIHADEGGAIYDKKYVRRPRSTASKLSQALARVEALHP